MPSPFVVLTTGWEKAAAEVRRIQLELNKAILVEKELFNKIRGELGLRVAKNLLSDWYLTRREQEVMVRLGKRYTNKEIAGELHITERTVKYHISQLFLKTGATHRRDLENVTLLKEIPNEDKGKASLTSFIPAKHSHPGPKR